jgi:hypothetical protein
MLSGGVEMPGRESGFAGSLGMPVVVSSGGRARSPLVGPVLSSMRPREVSVFSGATASGELAGAALTGAVASAGVFGTVAGAPAPGSLGIVGSSFGLVR